jgi:Uri superfamily endonuclease
MEKGSYVLVVKMDSKDVEVGALGEKYFDGIYAYNGSAFGPGGLSRVERHFRTARGEGSTHWHIDYLLRSGEVLKAYLFPGEDLECELSSMMDDPVPGFGSSDCDCSSHLFRFESVDQIEEELSGRGFQVMEPED